MPYKTKGPTLDDLKKVREKVRPIEVTVESGSREDLERALRTFKRIFQNERVIGQLKEKSTYEKPSEKKRRKRREACNRRLMAERRERMIKSGEWDRVQKKKAQRKIIKEEKRAGVFDD